MIVEVVKRDASGCISRKSVQVRRFTIFSLYAFISLSASSVFAQSPDTETTELEEIVVEEEGEPEAKLPLGVGISGETLRNAPGSAGDPVRTLQSLPGLTFTNDEEALPAVRGSRPDDNYFQADFAPVNYLFHLGGAISVFNADLVKTFNVYQSAYGPEFSGVTGGVFDVELRDPKDDRFRSTLDISLLQAGVLVEGPTTENQSFYLAGRISYLDLFLADQIPEEDDGVKIAQFPKYSDYQGKYVWKPSEANRVTFQFNGAADTAQIDVAEDSSEIETDPIVAGTTFFDTRFHEQALVWDTNVSDNLEAKILLSHSNSVEEGKFGGVGSIDVVTDGFFLKSQVDYAMNSNHDFIIGAQIERAEVDLDLALSIPPCGELDVDCILTGSERLTSKKKFNYTGVRAYLKDNWYITDRLTLYPGLAFQAEDILDKQFIEPRLALEYALSDATTLSAGLGQYQQAPDYLESDRVFGNPDLEYINALHAQVGVQRFFEDGWEIKSELYYKSLDNLVTSDDTVNYTNEGEGYSYGLDTLIRKDLSQKLSGWASLSLSKSRRKDKRTGETFVFDYDQPINVSLVGQYKLNNKWSFGTKLWVHSGAPDTPVIGSTEDPDIPGFYRPQYGKLNSSRFPAYKRLDIRIDRTFKRKKDNTMSAYLDFLNVLNTENAAGYDYNADYTEKKIAPQLTGIFSIGFKATF